jgi:peptidoglycan/LPS O-acetylase OafA/YrhL
MKKIYDDEVNNPKRVFSLDTLRALAIILVLVCHLISRIGSQNSTAYYFGTLGVEIFFVLSGFLIGGIIIKSFNEEDKFKIKKVKNFWVRRWFRTLPNYYLVLIVSIIIYSVYYHSFILKDLSNLRYFIFIQNLTNPPGSFFSVSWSLAVEEWFYLLFPLILLVTSKFVKDKYKTLISAVSIFILSIIILKIVIALSFTNLGFSSFQYMMPLRLDSIGFGILIAIIYSYRKELWDKHKIKLFVIGSILFISTSLYYYLVVLAENEGIIARIFFFDILSLSIAMLFPFLYSLKRFKNKFISRLIVHISLTSYSIYLVHLIIILIVIKLPLSAISKLIISVGAIFIITTIQYRFFEKPMTSMREKFSKPQYDNIGIKVN